MSEVEREVNEYARLYAIKHHMTIEEALNTAMVEQFKKERTRNGKVVSSGSGTSDMAPGN